MKTLSSIFTILLLALIASGAAAKGGKGAKVTIIHKPLKQAIEITVNENALRAHLAHGDCIVGGSGPEGCAPPPAQCISTAAYDITENVIVTFTGESNIRLEQVTNVVTASGVVCSADELDELLLTGVAVTDSNETYDPELLQVVKTTVDLVCVVPTPLPAYSPEPGEVAFDIGTLGTVCVLPEV